MELFEAGVEPDNHASRPALAAAGFQLPDPVGDCGGMLYYRTWTPQPRGSCARTRGPSGPRREQLGERVAAGGDRVVHRQYVAGKAGSLVKQ